MNEGWVKLHRRFLQWEWWDDLIATRLFIYCLLKANHQQTKWHAAQLQKGQFVTSYATIKQQTKLSLQQIRTGFDKLKSTGEITIKSTNHFSIIQVQNWENYQNNNTQNNTQSNIQATNEQQTSNNRQEYIKNDKNIYKDGKEKLLYPNITDVRLEERRSNNG